MFQTGNTTGRTVFRWSIRTEPTLVAAVGVVADWAMAGWLPADDVRLVLAMQALG